ncbi:MAG: hypothetical protein JWR35_2053 [Marmoricola sp.]|nr:hypothetical protein [Marmoricola sp.]
MIARWETEAWAGYYRREWRTVLRAGFGMVREGFGMSRLRTLRGAYHVMRANKAWAPYPDNDPELARNEMSRFYALVIRHESVELDPLHAAALEVSWWKLHRERQYGVIGEDAPLVEALVALYSYVYSATPDSVREAAEQRVRAMALSDEWVRAGCDRTDPLLAQEHDALLASYTSLREAV